MKIKLTYGDKIKEFDFTEQDIVKMCFALESYWDALPWIQEHELCDKTERISASILDGWKHEENPEQRPALKRFWLFAYDLYYPNGGIQDFFGDFESVLGAVEHANTLTKEKYHIFDSKINAIVFDFNKDERKLK